MTIITSTNKKIINYPFHHDPGDEKYYQFIYRPQARSNSTEYLLDDVVRPASANGYYYICINAGISGASEPTWVTKENGKVIDGPIIWQAKAYNMMLNTGDNITSSSFSATSGVTLSDPSESNGLASVKVTDVGSLTSFILTNTVSITRASGKIETFERSISVIVGDL